MSNVPEDIKLAVSDILEKIKENIEKSIFKGSGVFISFHTDKGRMNHTTVSLTHALPVGPGLSLHRSFNLLKAYRTLWNKLRQENEGFLVAAGFKVLTSLPFGLGAILPKPLAVETAPSIYDEIEGFARASISESKFNGKLEVGVIKAATELNGTKVPKALLHYWHIGDNIAGVPAFVKEHREEWEAEQKKHLDFVISKGLAGSVLNP